MMPVNLKSLAEQLHLSIATVSRALRDSHEVSEATKVRVRALATALHYEPNAYASSLRRNISKTIGVVIPKVANHFFALAINGIEEAARQSGYHVLIYLTHDDYEREVSIVQHLKGGRVDGLLMSVASGTEDFAHLKSLQEANLPIVFFRPRVRRNQPPPKSLPTTTKAAFRPPNTSSRRAAALSRTCSFPTTCPSASFGTRATSMPSRPTACRPDPDLVLHGVPDNNQNVALIRELLLRRPDIDGIFASVERLAISAYRVCHELGRRIPQDVSKSSVSPTSKPPPLLDPPLSTITQPAYDIGREAAKILLRAVGKEESRASRPERRAGVHAVQAEVHRAGLS